MASQIISFRLTEAEIDVLKTLQESTESIQQTAARIVREKLQIGIVDNMCTNSVQFTQQEIEQLVADKVIADISEAIAPILEQLNALESRLKSLENPPKKTTTRKPKTPAKTPE